MNYVKYEIAATAENAGLIDQINRLVIPGYGDTTTAVPAAKSAPTEAPKSVTKAAEVVTGDFDKVKSAAKAAKQEHGEDFVKAVAVALGGADKGVLLKVLSSVPTENHAELIATLEAGPTQQASDDLEDDLDDSDDDLEESNANVDPEAVKIALKAYNKVNGKDKTKALMAKYGASSLAEVDGLDGAKLAALFKAAQ